jgi:hypothetical protein
MSTGVKDKDTSPNSNSMKVDDANFFARDNEADTDIITST